MTHFSERLDRDYQDDDILTSHEVREVVALNSGRPVSSRWLSDTARILNLPKRKPGPRDVFYKYEDVKNLVASVTRGRQLYENPSPNALRQRSFKERRKERACQLRESPDGCDLPPDQEQEQEQGKEPGA